MTTQKRDISISRPSLPSSLSTYLQRLKVVLLVAGVLVQNEDVGADSSNNKTQIELQKRVETR